ncbi:Scramblase [Ancylostoma ceylanicum]|uniref:Phospholipid scramblase n=1 Tax=Ancylostoma ceylanicum TaxID=53326 RepID=A0A0D6LK85_9BILA|nr:Scramblase [Ancylostoma ceylanicum]
MGLGMMGAGHPVVGMQPGMGPGMAPGMGPGMPGTAAAVLMQDEFGARPMQRVAPPWMPVPDPIPGVPPGLEYLAMLDTVMIIQEMEPLEFMLGYETTNKYRVTNAAREQIYYAVEESGFFERQWYGNARPFTMHIIDNAQRDVMIVQSPYRAFSGGKISMVRQRRGCCANVFVVSDDQGTPVLKIKGPCCGGAMRVDVGFPVLTMDNFPVGSINKHWGGYLRETTTDADIFSATFPCDLDIRAKAGMLAATFMIDFMMFEDDQREKNERRGRAMGGYPMY